MSEVGGTFQCGDGEALMTFVYGESSPEERDAIASHLAWCLTCAGEIAALGSTRQQLAAWTPPEQTLGFRVTSSDAEQPAPMTTATVLRPAAWWSQPLPAWAQLAAAVVIFASGMAIGTTWSSPAARTTVATAETPAAATLVRVAAGAAEGATRQDLAQLEQRLRSELAQARAAAPAADTADTRVLLQRVNDMIAASEARQMKELEFRTSVLAQDWANRRVLDLTNIEKRLGSTTSRVISNQQDINSLAQRVGYSPTSSPYVP